MPACVFCEIANGTRAADVVFENAESLGILDHRPLFPGHVLVLPRTHYQTLADLPITLLPTLFYHVQLAAQAVESSLKAEGTFVAMNNRVSQSVPHLHVHIVPRTKGDGLKGFFWPRHAYRDQSHRESIRSGISAAMRSLMTD